MLPSVSLPRDSPFCFACLDPYSRGRFESSSPAPSIQPRAWLRRQLPFVLDEPAMGASRSACALFDGLLYRLGPLTRPTISPALNSATERIRGGPRHRPPDLGLAGGPNHRWPAQQGCSVAGAATVAAG